MSVLSKEERLLVLRALRATDVSLGLGFRVGVFILLNKSASAIKQARRDHTRQLVHEAVLMEEIHRRSRGKGR
jgi:hypothetical protein